MAEVKLTIFGEDKLDNVRKGLGDTERMLGMVKTAAAAVGLSLSVMAVANYAKEAALMTARYETMGAAMTVVGNNAGYTGEQMRAYQKTLQDTGISMMEARSSLTAMASAHIDLANSAKLARIAQDAAVIGGINSSEAFKSMVYGIQSAQVEVLRTIGLNVNFEDSYKKMGKQLGKNAEDLTELEKTQARTNAVMEKGKDIAGAYEAAMGTAGKQITSMQRYMDDLKIKVGEVFQDALTVAVGVFTTALKNANGEVDAMSRKGQIDAWGKNVLMTFATVADAIFIVYNVMKTLVVTAVAGFTQMYYGAKAFGQVMNRDFSGAADSFDNLKNAGKAWVNMVADDWKTATPFQDTAKKFLADKEAGQKNLDAYKAAEEARMKAGAATREEIAAKEAAAQVEKKFLGNLKNSIDGVKDYIAASKDLRKELLAVAGDRYSDNLKQQVELFKENQTSLSSLSDTMKEYGDTVNGIFDTRGGSAVAGLKAATAALDEFKIKVQNTNSKDAKTALTGILNAYKEASVNILEVEQTRQKTMLEGDRKVASEFLAIMNTKRKELESFKTWFDDVSKAYKEAIAPKVEYSDNYSRYFGELDKLKAKEAEVKAIADPTRRAEEIKKLATAQSGYTSAIVDGGAEIISAYDVQRRAEENIARLRALGETDIKTQGDAAEASWNQQKTKLEAYQTSLIRLDDLLAATRTIKIDFNVDASAVTNALDAIRAAGMSQTAATSAGQIGGGRPGMSASDYYQVGDSFYWGDGSYGGPAFERGTDSVSHTGLALGHQNEKITPAGQNRSDSSISISGGLNISLPNVTNQSTAGDPARELYPELQKLTRRQSA